MAGIGFVGGVRFIARNWLNTQGREEKLVLSFMLAIALTLMIPIDTLLEANWYDVKRDGQVEVTAYYERKR